MARRIKMVLYGEPGTGKSVFACKAPKPFFITTDGNYEWLEDFGADPNAYKRVDSWKEAKDAFADDYPNYETIVIDLTEDLYKWAEHEFCIKSKIDHLTDLGFGKGYDIVRTDFFIECCKLINFDKNIIFIMHGNTYVSKDRRGVEHTKYGPTPRMPDKLIDQLEGRVRYFLRCYVKGEERPDGTVEKTRWLSLVPKENEFGIIRGVDENAVPQDIPLDWNMFADAIGYRKEPEKIVEKKEHKRKVEVEVKEEPDDYNEKTKPEKTETERTQPTAEIKSETGQPKSEDNVEIKEEPAKKEEPKTNEDKFASLKERIEAAKLNAKKKKEN